MSVLRIFDSLLLLVRFKNRVCWLKVERSIYRSDAPGKGFPDHPGSARLRIEYPCKKMENSESGAENVEQLMKPFPAVRGSPVY
jgi:hypothetical protein